MTELSAIELLNKGGWLVWPIIVCSIVGMTIYFERFLLYRNVLSLVGSNKDIFSLVSKGKNSDAQQLINEKMTPCTLDKRVMNEALTVKSPDRPTIEMVLIHAVDREIKLLSRTLNTLAVLASIAPLLGLLGTVIGMIKAFSVVEAMGGSVNAAVLAGGIWEAMLTTAVGLLAAIPLLFFHNHLDGKLQTIQVQLEDSAVYFLKAWAEGREVLE